MKANKTELVKIPEGSDQLDLVLTETREKLANCHLDMQRAFITAMAVDQLTKLITPQMIAPIKSLMNTPLGFMTDKDPKVKNWKTQQFNEPYSDEIVKSCLVEAAMYGLEYVGNQFNIIGGRTYITKNGFRKLFNDMEHLDRFDPGIGIPRKLGETSYVVPFHAKWEWKDDERDELKGEIPVKADKYTTVDAVVGKAERKIRARVYSIIEGKEFPEGEIDRSGAIDVTSTDVAEGKDPSASGFGKAETITNTEDAEDNIDNTPERFTATEQIAKEQKAQPTPPEVELLKEEETAPVADPPKKTKREWIEEIKSRLDQGDIPHEVFEDYAISSGFLDKGKAIQDLKVNDIKKITKSWSTIANMLKLRTQGNL